MMTGLHNPTYPELLHAFLPRPIRGESDYQAVQTEVDRLIDRGDLSADEVDYLDLLGTLILEYEHRHEDHAHYELRGVELIKGLVELHGLRLMDLIPIFKTKSIASAILNRHRRLTAEHINRLALYFGLPHSLFFEPATSTLRTVVGVVAA